MMPMCLIFSPDKSEKLLKVTILLVKATSGSSFLQKAALEKLVTNSWISSSN
jgi:hypothetical protein